MCDVVHKGRAVPNLSSTSHTGRNEGESDDTFILDWGKHKYTRARIIDLPGRPALSVSICIHLYTCWCTEVRRDTSTEL